MSPLVVTALLILLLAILALLVLIIQRLTILTTQTRLAGQNEERLERTLREELARTREEAHLSARQGREELTAAMTVLGDSLLKRMGELAGLQKGQLDIFAGQLTTMTNSNERRMDKLREAVEARLQAMQNDNAQKLEQMRATVDEKLHDTLEKRLGESFKLVSERLEHVQRGLGEMQSLASGVGDLKKVLTNVKTRGIFGEVQLASLLEQILAPSQYAVNVETRSGSGQRVEFALRLPGREADREKIVWLPIDAKFPQEDYLRLVEAQELGDLAGALEAAKMLERAIRESARTIRDKYLDPPHTTDFGVMFIPTEGLYAEILRRPGLFDALQREYKVMVAGPTTLAALLNSLQMGFRTLAIEQRSAEVWNLLGAVRTEFHKFGEILDKTGKKLREAGHQIDAAAVRSRSIEKKLKGVQELPAAEAAALLESEPWDEESQTLIRQ